MSPAPTHLPKTQTSFYPEQPGIARPNRGSRPPLATSALQGTSSSLSGSRRSKINAMPVYNRIFAVMMHTNRYAFKAQARLASDCRVAPSTICRLLTGQSSPSFALVTAIADALEKQLKRRIDPRELVSINGEYATPWTCALCGCGGCLPDEAYDEDDRLRPEYRDVRPGEWTNLTFRFVRRALAENDLPNPQPAASGRPKTGTPQPASLQEEE